jgi:hypothetical protein
MHGLTVGQGLIGDPLTSWLTRRHAQGAME